MGKNGHTGYIKNGDFPVRYVQRQAPRLRVCLFGVEPLDSLAAAAAPFAALPAATPAMLPAETATPPAMPFEAWEKVGKVVGPWQER